MPYSVFLDLDGTLLSAKHPEFSDYTLKILTDAQAEGHKIFLNTARTIANVPFDAFRGFKFDGYLCGCAYINVGGKVLMADGLSADQSQPIAAHFYNRNIPVYLEGEFAIYTLWDKNPPARFIPLDDIYEIFKVCELEPITKISICSDLPEEDVLFLQQFGNPLVHVQHHYTEVVPPNHDKAYVMKAVVDYLDLDPEKVIAMGDSENDLAMLDAAAIPVVMGNALDEIKAHGKHVTLAASEDGVAAFLEKFLEI